MNGWSASAVARDSPATAPTRPAESLRAARHEGPRFLCSRRWPNARWLCQLDGAAIRSAATAGPGAHAAAGARPCLGAASGSSGISAALIRGGRRAASRNMRGGAVSDARIAVSRAMIWARYSPPRPPCRARSRRRRVGPAARRWSLRMSISGRADRAGLDAGADVVVTVRSRSTQSDPGAARRCRTGRSAHLGVRIRSARSPSF